MKAPAAQGKEDMVPQGLGQVVEFNDTGLSAMMQTWLAPKTCHTVESGFLKQETRHWHGQGFEMPLCTERCSTSVY